jgi:hypothetical protein
MADGKRIGKWTKVYFDAAGSTAQEITTSVTNIPQLPLTFQEIEAGGYGEEMNYLGGRGDSQITIEMLFTTTASVGTHTVFAAYMTSANRNVAGTLTVQIGDNAAPTTGSPEFEGEFIVQSYVVVPELNGAVRATATLRVAVGQALPAWGTVSA